MCKLRLNVTKPPPFMLMKSILQYIISVLCHECSLHAYVYATQQYQL